MSKREYLIVTEPERLKEFGFECENGRHDDDVIDSDYRYYYYDFDYDFDNFDDEYTDSTLRVEQKNGIWYIRTFYLDGDIYLYDLMCLLYDLITAGIVKKVEE